MSNQIEKISKVPQEKNITDKALNTIADYVNNGVLHLPKNYSVENAMKSAYLTLEQTKTKDNKPVLQACDRTSIYQALLDMAIQGLSPAKNQCYFVAYGSKLTLMRSYLGTIALTKRIPGVKDVKAYPIYQGDKFKTQYDIDTGVLRVVEFEPQFDNGNAPIIGAFAVVIGENGILHTETMSMAQIRNSWEMGASNGKSKAHTKFSEEMVKKTVINRACKRFVNTSDDTSLFNEAYQNTKEYEDENIHDRQIEEEIKENANTTVIDMDEITDVEFEEVAEEVTVEEEKQEEAEQEEPKEEVEQITMDAPF